MRYIGNKTRLLDFIGAVLESHGLRGRTNGARHERPLHAVDAFAGTASVGRFLKRQGFRVTGCDIMTYSYVLQRAYVEVDRTPRFTHMAEKRGIAREYPTAAARLDYMIRALNTLPLNGASVIRNAFSSSTGEEDGRRMYFTDQNGRRIDKIRITLGKWLRAGTVTENEFYVLLAALLEALDSVANTTGVYAAYVKSWQSNALRRLTLRTPELTTGTNLACKALQGDINTLAPGLGPVDLLYLDPPYNSRQYSGYYHIPELVAMGWDDGAPVLRGKTGLIPNSDKRSMWSRRGGCVTALHNLLDNIDARYVLMSYNSEGIIPESEIRDAFVSRGVRGTFRLHERDYARYRSDSDRAGRRYKGSRVTERIYFVELRR